MNLDASYFNAKKKARKPNVQRIPRNSFYPHAVDGWYIFETRLSVSHILKILIIYSQH